MKTILNRKISFLLIFSIHSLTSAFAQNLISYTFPSQNQIHVARNSQIIIGFNETIIDSTLNNNSIVAYGTLSGRHFGNIYYDSINSKMIYTPLKTFASGEKFFVSLTKEIKSISGDSLIPAFTFEFQVRSDTGYNYMTCTKYQNISGLNTIEDMKVADMDIDGDYDLVFSSYYSFLSGRRVMVFMNDGEANFQGSYYFWLPAKPTHLSIGDFNNDGVQDVAVVTSDQVLFLTNNGSGQLSNWGSVEINYSGILINCDFNNDGRIDVLGLELDDNSNPWKREVSFIKNLGDGNFEKINSYSFTSNISSERFYIDVADFNNDGFIDIIISNILLNQVYILLNNGEGIFSLGTIKYINPKPWSLTVGDFDNDSDIDLSVSKESGWEGLDIYENMGNTVFVYYSSFYLGSYAWKSFCTDFNNDGNVDIAATYRYGRSVGVYFGDGDLFFDDRIEVLLDPALFPQTMEFADFDGDGDVDILVLNDDSNNRKLYFLQNGPTINSVEEEQNEPIGFSISQNYPNPFNPSTKIKYSIPAVGTSLMKFVQLKVYDVLGNEITTLVSEEKPTGEYEVEFSSANLPSGIYFYRLQAGSFIQTKKMILLR